MAGAVPLIPRYRFSNPTTGAAYAGGTLTVYLAGTTTLSDTFQDSSLTTANENPITLDANGECLIWTDPSQRYKFLLADSAGVTVSGWPVDNILGGIDLATITSDLTATITAAETATESARDTAILASATSGVYQNSAASNVPRGLTQASVGAITAGAGGTNGTFALAWAGGNFSINPTGTFTVAGGALTAVTITGPGLYIGAAPTVPTPSFATSAGLGGGAAVVLTAQFLVTSGQGYWVTSSDGLSLDRYKNVSGVATSDTANVGSIPTVANFDAAYHERLFAAQARYFANRRMDNKDVSHRKAAIVVMLGQSNNTPGVNTPALSATPSLNAYMPFGTTALQYFAFHATNAEYPCNYTDVGTVTQYVETTSEGPGAGLIVALEGLFPRMYVCSAALGGTPLLKLTGGGPRCNLYAVVHKLCDHARTAGFEPVVMVTSVHGEANMGGSADLTEDNYYTYGLQYYRDCQKAAAQAMQRPEYRAPVVLHFPAQMDSEDSRQIHNAIARIGAELTNCILTSSINQWEVNSDAIHNSAVAFRERGEWDGYLLRRFFMDGKRTASPRVVNCVRTSLSVVLTFDQEVAQRTTVSLGTALNAANQLNGVEYLDNGSYIKINAMTFNGRTCTLTLNSLPVGAANTQFVRMGMQTTVTSVTWPTQMAGLQIAAANDTGEVSIYDSTKRAYHYAVPFQIAVR